MVVVAVGLGDMGVDILSQRGAHVRPLQIMRGQRIAGKDSVHITVFNQLAHGLAGVAVKGEGRTHDPYDFAVLAVVAQKIIQLVIILRIGSLAAAIAAEGKYILGGLLLAEAVGMQVDAILAAFGTAYQHLFALLQQAELLNRNAAVFQYSHAVHAAFLGQQPLAIHLDILGIDAHGMKVFRRNAVFFHGNKTRVRCGKEGFLRKIRMGIGSKLEHDEASSN